MIARTRAIRNIEISRSRMVYVCHSAPAFFVSKYRRKELRKMNIKFDKKNVCSHDINIATLEMLNNLLLLENLVSFDFPFSWLSAEGG